MYSMPWICCHASLSWCIWLSCGWCLHECYWWFKQLVSEAPKKEEVIIVDNTVTCHTILQKVPIKKNHSAVFPGVTYQLQTTLVFSFTLRQHKLIVVLQVHFFCYLMFSLIVSNEFMYSRDTSLLSIMALLFNIFEL